MSYVELHCHSNFSFLDGASHPEQLISRAAELGYSALAITDHNGLYGVVRFSQAALEHGVKPIFGSEISLDDGSHLILLAEDQIGYANLSQLISRAQLSGEKGDVRISHDLLADHNKGLIALSGCQLGSIPTALLKGDKIQAANLAAQYRELFGPDNFFLELQHHNLPTHKLLCDRLIDLGQSMKIGLVATNNVHYARRKDRPLQDVLTCIKHHTTLDEANELLYPNTERYLKSPQQMMHRFKCAPEAIANSLLIANRCWFMLRDLKTSLPDFHPPDDMNMRAYLRQLVYRGASRRYGDLTEIVINQIEHELRIINKLDLTGYFLIVWDIVRFCTEQGILAQGRGSAANSAVCYCLTITAVDPIKLQLLFERFVSEERKEPPDIDIDIANNRREEVIQYVYNKYGREHAAMVCEVISYRGRSAVRDVGKALGFSLEEVNKLAKMIDHYSAGDDFQQRLAEAGLNCDHRRVKCLVYLCKAIHRFPRHLGIHVGGMIVTKMKLSQIVPIENATMPQRSVIQWDKDDVEEVRLVKIDLLGLGMLSLIDTAFKLVKKHRKVSLDMAAISYDDPAIYDLLGTADTVGIFQVESRAQMNTLPRHKPRRFYDLVVEVALIRPGPIQGGMVHPYLRRRNGEEPITYPHPSLEPVLKRTLGIPLFQEQGMQVAMIAAGFTPSQADELRRAMGHKRSREKMEALQEKMIQGMMANGIDLDAALNIFKQLAAFADFGFAESHAASFALLVYVSAFLKVYYPQEFYCALLNSQPMGFYSPSTIVYEARQRGIKMLPVDISKSHWDCTIEADKVRLGFRQVKSLGETVKEKIETELTRSPFISASDFVRRTELSQLNLEQLALVGAFRRFGLTRRQALWEILSLVKQDKDALSITDTETGLDLLTPMRLPERLAADFKGMSLSTGPHPMALVRRDLKKRGILSASDLRTKPNKATVLIAGIVIIRQRPATAKGFMFVTLEDETGFANIVVKPHYLQQCRKALVYSKALLVKGVLETRENVVNVIGKQFTPLQMSDNLATPRSRDFR